MCRDGLPAHRRSPIQYTAGSRTRNLLITSPTPYPLASQIVRPVSCWSVQCSVVVVVVVVLPSISSTRSRVTPPALKITVPHHRLVFIMQQGTEATPELGVNELSGAMFPREILVVQLVRLVESLQVFGQLFGGCEIFDVNVRMCRCYSLVVLSSAAHHDWNHVASIAPQHFISTARQQ